jgi:hypothetical protein
MTIREQGQASGADASVGQLVQRLSAQVSTLVRDEMAQATAERKRKGAQAGIGIVIEWCRKVKAQVVGRGSELFDRGVDVAERVRESVSQTPTDRWAKLAGAGLALLAMTVIVRRVRTS